MVGCSNLSGSNGPAPAPVKEGDYLRYHVTETDRAQKTSEKDILLTFLAASQLGLGEEKKPIATLNSDLAPVDGQPISESDLGLVYLPPGDRRSNASTRAGLVQYQKQWERWNCWVVQVREGDLSGQRYFESRTGLMVGYELNMDNPNQNKGFFRRALLTTTNIAGLL